LSHPKFHQRNINLIINLFLDNGYPLQLIFDKINERVKGLIHKKNVLSEIRSIPILISVTMIKKS